MGRKTVVTTDKYGNQKTYNFKPNPNGIGVTPENGYTPVVLKTLWNAGIPVNWSPNNLSPTERSEIDGFCDRCGTEIKQNQIAPREFNHYCPKCDQ